MSEHEGPGAPDLPEFVAVTPRGVTPEPPAPQEPAAEPEPEPGPEPQPPVAAEAAPEAPAEAAEPAATIDEPTEKRATVPSLEEVAAADAPATGPEAKLPEPQPQAAGGDVEVSVRVAAEGMAAALAGQSVAADDAGTKERALSPVVLATAVFVVLAIAAGALLAVAAHTTSHRRAVAAARVQALAAAKADTVLLLSYTYQTIDQDSARAEAVMSAKFRANYANTLATDVKPLALKNHASTRATVAAAGVVSATPSSAKVLVFADQVVQNTLLNAVSRLDRTVIEVTMIKQGKRWVIDDVQTF